MQRNVPATISRRRVMQLAAMSVGTAVVATSLGTPALADPNGSGQIGAGQDGAGQDGAPAGDTRFQKKFAKSTATAGSGVKTSYNGWPVGTPASSIGVGTYYAPGTSILIPVKSGDVGTVLMYVAGRFNSRVEALQDGQVWGYDYRKNVNNPKVWSNHASGTAIDLNSAWHPNGAKGTFSAGQVAQIRAILAFCGDVIYWGGDYSGVTDEMHFEIDVPPADFRLSALAARIRGGPTQPGSRGATIHDGRLDMFGVGIHGGMFQAISNDGINFSKWAMPFRGTFRSVVSATCHNQRYDIFAVGANATAYHTYFSRSWAPELYELGGSFQGGLSATYHDGRYDVFGVGTDGTLYQCTSDDGIGFDAWHAPVGGDFKGTPAAVYHGGQYDVFALGTDDRMHRMSWNGGWQPRASYGSISADGGLSATYLDGRYDIFAVSTDGVLRQSISTDGVEFSDWGAPLGGGFRSTPSSVHHEGRYDLFLQRSDSSMCHAYWDGRWSPIRTLGGKFLA